MKNKDVIINVNINIFVQNYLVANPQQLTNMHGSLKTVLSYFEKDKKTRPLNEKLKLMYYKPIEYVNKHTDLPEFSDKKILKAMPKTISLADLEWLAYRESKFRTKLNSEYLSGKGWRSKENKIIFAYIITIFSQIKTDLYGLLTELLQNFDFGTINIILPELSKTEKDGGDPLGKVNY